MTASSDEAITWLRTRSSWTGHSCHKVADVLDARIEKLETELEVERKVSAAMGQQQKALMAELTAKDAVVEAARELLHNRQLAVFSRKLDHLEDALRALDQPCETCGGSGMKMSKMPTAKWPESTVESDCPDCGGE